MLSSTISTNYRLTNDKYEHLIVTVLGSGPHCMYVKDVDVDQGEVHCINSWGNESKHPEVAEDRVLRMYRVSVMLHDRETGFFHSQTKLMDQVTNHSLEIL